jgi:PPM family protein phosphatase
MSRDEARHSPMGHVLVNVLGGRSHDLFVDVDRLTLERDDVLLLCTHGQYDMIDDETLKNRLTSVANAEAACRNLIDLANANGGKDNITVVISRFLSPRPERPRALVEAEVPLEQLTVPS